jgi:hypothetical protein
MVMLKRRILSQTINAVMLVTLFVGCAAETATQDTPRVSSEKLPDGRLLLKTSDAITSQAPDGIPGEAEDETSLNKAKDCVYIQWCDEPPQYGGGGTICRFRAGCVWNDETEAECVRDTDTVCGGPVAPWYLF